MVQKREVQILWGAGNGGLRRGSQVLINAETGEVGTGTNLSGNPTNQDFAALIWNNFYNRHSWR